jgi:hypothetical protein
VHRPISPTYVIGPPTLSTIDESRLFPAQASEAFPFLSAAVRPVGIEILHVDFSQEIEPSQDPKSR